MGHSRAEKTKQALLNAAFPLFAENGFAATSTREIAVRAKCNVASITYHFGSKEGLHIACAKEMTNHMTALRNDPGSVQLPDIVNEAQSQFEAKILAQAYILMRMPKASTIIKFLLREAQDQSKAFDYIYENFFMAMFNMFQQDWLETTHQTEEDETSLLTVFTIIGQLAYFRVGQPIILRRMQWNEYGEAETRTILRLLQTNIRTLVNHYRSKT